MIALKVAQEDILALTRRNTAIAELAKAFMQKSNLHANIWAQRI